MPNGVNCDQAGGDCRQQYTVTVGTVFESSKVGLHKWLYVNHILCSSKKGTSAHQIARNIGVSYKTAWFMMHRTITTSGTKPGMARRLRRTAHTPPRRKGRPEHAESGTCLVVSAETGEPMATTGAKALW